VHCFVTETEFSEMTVDSVFHRRSMKLLFVWAVAGWLCRESCCAEKAAVQGKLLSRISLFGDLAGCLAVC
jgi:hypothetical protein